MTTFVEPLALQTIIVNMLAGSIEIFIAIAFIFMAGLAARFRMPNFVTLTMFATFGIVMSRFLGGLYILILLVMGMITFISIAKMFR